MPVYTQTHTYTQTHIDRNKARCGTSKMQIVSPGKRQGAEQWVKGDFSSVLMGCWDSVMNPQVLGGFVCISAGLSVRQMRGVSGAEERRA